MSPSHPSGRRLGRPHSVAGTDVRERLLDAAVTRFAQEGVAATSTAKIANDAGVTAAMVHYYFTNRRSLLDAIAEERLLRNVNAVWASVTDSKESAPDLVRGLVHRIVHAAQTQPWLPTLWLREVASEGGQLRERILSRLPLAQLQTFMAKLAAAQGHGDLNPAIQPRLVLVSLIGLTLLPLATMGVWRRVPQLQDISHEELARHAEGLLLHGLFGPWSKRPRRAGA